MNRRDAGLALAILGIVISKVLLERWGSAYYLPLIGTFLAYCALTFSKHEEDKYYIWIAAPMIGLCLTTLFGVAMITLYPPKHEVSLTLDIVVFVFMLFPTIWFCYSPNFRTTLGMMFLGFGLCGAFLVFSYFENVPAIIVRLLLYVVVTIAAIARLVVLQREEDMEAVNSPTNEGPELVAPMQED